MYVAIVIKHDDDYKSDAPTITKKVFRVKENARNFVYRTLIEELGYYDKAFDDDEMEEHFENREIVRGIVYHDAYEPGSDEYDQVFGGEYIKYRAEFEITKQDT
ncbi:MAG: hypothetical protein EOO42_22020 [Flavobacteriales bacterium]|nr:MAG: hypothetical protein EOO42_22020 [Flavobacteriales bacterium]